MLDDEDFDVRRYALMALADRHEPEALPAIKRALTDSNPEMRRFAIAALSEYEDSESLSLLRMGLDDKDIEVRRHALMVIAEREDSESLPIFINLLDNDPDAEIRKYAAMALGEIGDVEAVEALTRALEDQDVEVRRYATMALSELDYGDEEDWDNDDWDHDDWDDDEFDDDDDEWGLFDRSRRDREEVDWEGGEAFGAAMAELGISAGQLGVAVGELSLNLTSDVLSELALNLEGLELDGELASLVYDQQMSEMELEEALFELEHLQLELEEEWSEELLDSILETLDKWEPLFDANSQFCEDAYSVFDGRNNSSRDRIQNKLACSKRRN